MEVNYRTNNLRKMASKSAVRHTELGTVRAENFQKRIDELKNADCLEDLRFLPQAKIHELKGNRKGQFSASLSGNFRLIFVPKNKPEPRRADGGWDWSSITIVEITEIIDYHGN